MIKHQKWLKKLEKMEEIQKNIKNFYSFKTEIRQMKTKIHRKSAITVSEIAKLKKRLDQRQIPCGIDWI